VENQAKLEQQAQFAAWSGALINIALTVVKGVIGVSSGSRALTADAVHSAADVVGSLAVIIGLRIARKPPDEDHPYGHGKAELISTAIVAGFLVAAGLEVGYGAVRSLFTVPHVPNWTAAGTALGAIIVKEILFRYNYKLGKRLNSKSLLASAYDNRSDVISSLAAFLGICLSLLGQSMHWPWLRYMDGVAGAVVAIFVLRMAVVIARDSLQTLMDRVVVSEHHLTPYRDFIAAVPGVRSIDDIRVRDHGQYVIVDVKIGVDANICVADGHDIARNVKTTMIAQVARVQDVFVHVNPYYGNIDAQRTEDTADD